MSSAGGKKYMDGVAKVEQEKGSLPVAGGAISSALIYKMLRHYIKIEYILYNFGYYEIFF